MKYIPVSEKEYQERNLLPASDYAFEVIDAQPDVSKRSGADMIVLDLLIHTAEGGNSKLKAYLVGTEGGKFQVRAFCKATGLISQYEAGTFNAESCLGRSGWVKIKIEQGNLKDANNPQSERWPDKNAVAKFLDAAPAGKPAAVAAPVNPAQTQTAPDTEDVPF